MENAWTREIDEIARELAVDLHTGLTDTQVHAALSKYGKNGICHLHGGLLTGSIAGGFTDSAMAAGAGTVQGSVGDYIAWFGGDFVWVGVGGGGGGFHGLCGSDCYSHDSRLERYCGGFAGE
jgi:Cation transporter/ATPase, N-terminus